MTAPAPSQIQWTTGTTLTPTCNVGDLLVVVQHGEGGNSSTTKPTSGSGGDWGLGPDVNGADVEIGAGNPDGRCHIWSKLAESGDSGANVTVNTTGYTAQSFGLFVIPGNWSSSHATAGTGRLLQVVQSSANTGSTPFTLTDATRGKIVITAVGYTSTQTPTIDWDTTAGTGATADNRVPYCDGNSGATTTTGGHSNHYGSGRAIAWADYQEYDNDEPGTHNFLWNNGMGNTTHAVGAAVYIVNITQTVNTVTETDTAQSFGKAKVKALGTVAETDTAQPITVTAGHFIEVVQEADSIQSVGRAKSRALTTVAETDTAQPITFARFVAADTVTESDTPQTLIATKTWRAEVSMTDPPASEVVTKAQLTASKNYPVDTGDIRFAIKQNGSTLQTSDWFAITDTPTQQTLTLDTPTAGTGFSVWWEVRTTGSLDPFVQLVQILTAISLGTVQVTVDVRPIAKRPNQFINIVTETDSAQSLTHTKTKTVGLVTETDTARPIFIGAGELVTGIIHIRVDFKNDQRTTFENDQRTSFENDQRVRFRSRQ